LLKDINDHMEKDSQECAVDFDDGKLWFMLVSLAINSSLLFASIYDNEGSMFKSRLNRTKAVFNSRFKCFLVWIFVCNVTQLSIGIPAFMENTPCPNISRLYYLFDMVLSVARSLNIALEFYHSRSQLGQIV